MVVKSQEPVPTTLKKALLETIATMIINVQANKSVATYITLCKEDAKFPRNFKDLVSAHTITMDKLELDIATLIGNAHTDINVAVALMEA